jgi:hypothetical protein
MIVESNPQPARQGLLESKDIRVDRHVGSDLSIAFLEKVHSKRLALLIEDLQ